VVYQDFVNSLFLLFQVSDIPESMKQTPTNSGKLNEHYPFRIVAVVEFVFLVRNYVTVNSGLGAGIA
jgi:hypothetical protein